VPPLSQGAPCEEPDEILECVVNVSEGRDATVLNDLRASSATCLLDVHSDGGHNRSVFTMAGSSGEVEEATKALTIAALARIDVSAHSGAHPRFGAVDVVPWVPLEGRPLHDAAPHLALQSRDRFASWAAAELGLPVFLYGPERSLPDIRRNAWRSLPPDLGPPRPHPTGGSVAVGLRPLMVAYNLWMAKPDLAEAQAIAAGLRSPMVRTMSFSLAGQVQVSCNLLSPLTIGPAEIYDLVAERAPIGRAELVGLVPAAVLGAVPRERWESLDLSVSRTIEAKLDGWPARPR